MAITINGSAGTITGISAGGLPNGVIVNDDIANTTITDGKLATTLDFSSKTVTLPAGTGGKLVNVAQTIIDSKANFAARSANSFARFPEMDVTYTTTVAGSIYVSFNWALLISASSYDATFKLYRKIGSGPAVELLVNSSPLASTNTGVFGNFRGNTPNEGDRFVYSFLDTPGHTAGDVITYEHHLCNQGQMSLNVPRQTNGYTSTCVSPIVFMEMAP